MEHDHRQLTMLRVQSEARAHWRGAAPSPASSGDDVSLGTYVPTLHGGSVRVVQTAGHAAGPHRSAAAWVVRSRRGPGRSGAGGDAHGVDCAVVEPSRDPVREPAGRRTGNSPRGRLRPNGLDQSPNAGTWIRPWGRSIT